MLSNSLFKNVATSSSAEIPSAPVFLFDHEDFTALHALIYEIYTVYEDYKDKTYVFNVLNQEITNENFANEKHIKLLDSQLASLINALRFIKELGVCYSITFGSASSFYGETRSREQSKNIREQGELLFNKIFNSRAKLIAALWEKSETADPTAVNWFYKLPDEAAKRFKHLYIWMGDLHLRGDNHVRARFLPYEYECLAHIATFSQDFKTCELLRRTLLCMSTKIDNFSHIRSRMSEENVGKLKRLTSFSNLEGLAEINYRCSNDEKQKIFDKTIELALEKQSEMNAIQESKSYQP